MTSAESATDSAKISGTTLRHDTWGCLSKGICAKKNPSPKSTAGQLDTTSAPANCIDTTSNPANFFDTDGKADGHSPSMGRHNGHCPSLDTADGHILTMDRPTGASLHWPLLMGRAHPRASVMGSAPPQAQPKDSVFQWAANSAEQSSAQRPTETQRPLLVQRAKRSGPSHLSTLHSPTMGAAIGHGSSTAPPE